MADLRKWLVAFAGVALTLALQTPAKAQFGTAPAFACTANAGVPPIVRAEGVTELVGDLILNCTGGTPTSAGSPIPLSNVQIFLNTFVTSRLLGSASSIPAASEAVMTIDEPYPAGSAVPGSTIAPAVANAPQTQLACSAIGLPSNPCAITGVGITGISTTPAIGPVGSNGPYNGSAGHYNIFQGIQTASNSVSWLGVPIDAPGTVSTRVIRITNVRANACNLGVSSTLIPTQIVMYISVNGSQQVTINNPQQTVAFIQNGLVVTNRSANFVQCNNLNAYTFGLTTSSSANGVSAGPTYLTATEGFASSFKVRSYDQVPGPKANSTPSLQNVLGFSYNTESGFVPATSTGAVQSGTSTGSIGLADTGTQISVSFAAVQTGVSLFVPTTIYLYATGAANSCFAAATCTGYPAATGVATLVGGTSGTATNGVTFGNVVVSGGTATVTYEVIQSNPNVLEQMVIPVYLAFLTTGTTSATTPVPATASVNFAPLASSTGQNASGTLPIPRFCQKSPVANFSFLNPCTCNLLFPFVTAQAGFDTGIAIANTSSDPFGTVTQAGVVKLNYYGVSTGGGAAPTAQTSTSVAAGSELVFTLVGGGDHGITSTPGFQGYIIAQAQFQYCHGFAFISDLGAQKLAEGYLAIQLDIPSLNRTGVAGENEGH